MNIKTGILAIMAAGIVANPVMAEPEVYGKVNIDLQSSDEAGVSQVELKSNASRFGVKGDEELDNDLKAIYQFEWEVDPSDKSTSSTDHIKSRNQFVGLQGGFGKLLLGRKDTAMKSSQGKFDQFNDLEGDIKHTFNGENRLSNFIGYTTPTFGDAFAVEVNLIPGESPDPDPTLDQSGIADGTSIALTYDADGLWVALAHDSDIDGIDVTTDRLTAVYKMGDFQIGGLYQTTDINVADADGFGASFAYKMGDGTFKLQYLDADLVTIGMGSLKSQSSIGYDYKLGSSTKLFAFYTTGDLPSGESNDYLGFGIEQKF